MKIEIKIHEALGLHHVSIFKPSQPQICVAWFSTRAEADELASKLALSFETSGVGCLVTG
jgi:hypothetical protein